mmetsp:Transcript_1895/g.2497  ORF Transcript_1895/g.2497 Transcript_1895/m.2497 type:complete len:449 (-) Transcript_1895:246-1592(-)
MKFLMSTLALAGAAMGADFAVIVAGSSGYGNYRHQADACHAYQICHKWGIPDENIITMMYDDIANSIQNPFRGQIFNAPGSDSVDVNKGCKKDYTGMDVTPDNFLAVLTGDATKVPEGKPVLNSTSTDRVFINFVDHGGVGSIAFPHSLLSKSKLLDALKTAHSKQMFEKMVFYLEACESGSMFSGDVLDPSMNIYATTAANADESSWGTYCPPQDTVNGKHLNTCLGDLYSVNWMQNAEKAGQDETLAAQFSQVQKLTTKSHVSKFGDEDFTSDPIGDYMGNGDSSKNVSRAAAHRVVKNSADGGDETPPERANEAGMVSSRDIPVHLAYYSFIRADSSDLAAVQASAQRLKDQIDARVRADTLFYTLAHAFNKPHVLTAKAHMGDCPNSCCDTVNDMVYAVCGGYTDYSLKFIKTVHNLCVEMGGDGKMLAEKVNSLCTAGSHRSN